MLVLCCPVPPVLCSAALQLWLRYCIVAAATNKTFVLCVLCMWLLCFAAYCAVLWLWLPVLLYYGCRKVAASLPCAVPIGSCAVAVVLWCCGVACFASLWLCLCCGCFAGAVAVLVIVLWCGVLVVCLCVCACACVVLYCACCCACVLYCALLQCAV